MAKLIDIMGQKFGRLTVISRAENGKTGQPRWNCKCDCGGKTITLGGDLRSGGTKSCGCLQRELLVMKNTTHGMGKTPIYKNWKDMRKRCLNPSSREYKHYGGRGITVCDRWMKFENFYGDMGEKPNGTSIDRIDNNKGYSPDNCRWATQKEQTRNQRTNRIIKYEGKEQCLAVWAEELGIKYTTLWHRLEKYLPQIAFNM